MWCNWFDNQSNWLIFIRCQIYLTQTNRGNYLYNSNFHCLYIKFFTNRPYLEQLFSDHFKKTSKKRNFRKMTHLLTLSNQEELRQSSADYFIKNSDEDSELDSSSDSSNTEPLPQTFSSCSIRTKPIVVHFSPANIKSSFLYHNREIINCRQEKPIASGFAMWNSRLRITTGYFAPTVHRNRIATDCAMSTDTDRTSSGCASPNHRQKITACSAVPTCRCRIATGCVVPVAIVRTANACTVPNYRQWITMGSAVPTGICRIATGSVMPVGRDRTASGCVVPNYRQRITMGSEVELPLAALRPLEIELQNW